MIRTGTAALPLHAGRCPRWLFERMVELSKEVARIIVFEYGRQEFLRRISDPFWFQAFACVLGFDWHSSGTTTTTCGALKVALSSEELGLRVCGGKGRVALRVLEEIGKFGKELELRDEQVLALQRASRMAAKVDNSCVQDGYQLYHHALLLSEDGDWAVVQQGMSEGYARRYHWFSAGLKSFVEEPHSGICSDRFEERVLDLTSKANEEVRKASLDLVRGFEAFEAYLRGHRPLFAEKALVMPTHHHLELREASIAALRRACELQPNSYEELVALRGVGAGSLRALALLSQLIYGTELDWQDPAKFSFAHGGKDGHPFPVKRKRYEKSIQILRDAVENAELGKREKLDALRRLKDFLGE